MRRRHPERVWFGLLITGTVLETWALRGKRADATFSYLTRKTLRTHHPVGKVVFLAIWGWFAVHIVNYNQEVPRDKP